MGAVPTQTAVSHSRCPTNRSRSNGKYENNLFMLHVLETDFPVACSELLETDYINVY